MFDSFDTRWWHRPNCELRLCNDGTFVSTQPYSNHQRRIDAQTSQVRRALELAMRSRSLTLANSCNRRQLSIRRHHRIMRLIALHFAMDCVRLAAPIGPWCLQGPPDLYSVPRTAVLEVTASLPARSADILRAGQRACDSTASYPGALTNHESQRSASQLGPEVKITIARYGLSVLVDADDHRRESPLPSRRFSGSSRCRCRRRETGCRAGEK